MLATNALGRALYAPVFDDPVRRANAARFTFLFTASQGVLPRLGPHRPRYSPELIEVGGNAAAYRPASSTGASFRR